MAYCKEKDLAAYAAIADFPIIPCNLCGSQKNMQRQVVKGMMQEWDKNFPGRLETMFRSIQNIQLSHLADLTRYDFRGLKASGEPVIDGDKAFDEEVFEATIEEMTLPMGETLDENNQGLRK